MYDVSDRETLNGSGIEITVKGIDKRTELLGKEPANDHFHRYTHIIEQGS